MRAETIQPTPRNIGRRNAHNTNPSIAPIIPTAQRRTLFMRLRLEMDALPRLIDMLLFVFIVRHFFYASIDYRSFACSLTRPRAEAKKGCSPFGLKIQAVPTGRSGDFSAKRQKNSPAPHVLESEQARLPELIVSHNLELRLRNGENE